MKINSLNDIGFLDAISIMTGSARIYFPPRREMTWQTGFSGQNTTRNAFPPDDEYMKHLAKGMRALDQNEMHCRHMAQMAAAQNAMANGPKLMPFAAKAAHLNRMAKTPRERKAADLMEFVAKYRDGCHVVTFPGWLSKAGRERLLEIAKRRA